MTETKPKVAAVYVRVSTSRQEAENQKLQLLPHCEKNGYTVYQIYADIMSGAEDHRPAFNRMFKDAHQHKFDLVLFWSLDRFSRSGLDFTVQKLKELSNAGVAWESYSEPYIKTIGPFGDVVLALMATLAKVERQRLSDRTKAGLARKMATGWRPGRKKGVKDKKPRKRRGYYGQQNWAGTKKGVSAATPQNIPETVKYSQITEPVLPKNKDAYLAQEKQGDDGA